MCDIFYSKNSVYLRTTIVKHTDYRSGRNHYTYCSAPLPQKEQTVCSLKHHDPSKLQLIKCPMLYTDLVTCSSYMFATLYH